ncbi:MAG: hypothetical protein QW057_03000 [Candidatus Bathyarchaeia archaeon]
MRQNEGQTYAYPSVTFVDDKALIRYHCDHRSLKLTITSVDWFYERCFDTAHLRCKLRSQRLGWRE